MSENNCNFCNKNFKSISSLNNHKKTAKFCLKIQNNENPPEFVCEYYSKNFTRKDIFQDHIESCKKRISLNAEKINIELDKSIKTIEKLEYELKIKDIKIEEQNKNTIELKKIINELNEKLLGAHKAIEELAAKAIENAGNKITNITKNQIYNALQPLTDVYMREQSKFLTYNNVKNGAHGIAHFASNHTFKDRVYCSDKSRLNFIFKNENDIIIKDPEGIEITKKFIETNKDELLRLIQEYIEYIQTQLFADETSKTMYEFWVKVREEFIAIRSAVVKGNVADNQESYAEFKRNFLTALSNLVPR